VLLVVRTRVAHDTQASRPCAHRGVTTAAVTLVLCCAHLSFTSATFRDTSSSSNACDRDESSPEAAMGKNHAGRRQCGRTLERRQKIFGVSEESFIAPTTYKCGFFAPMGSRWMSLSGGPPLPSVRVGS
jgi:hypothetical protein